MKTLFINGSPRKNGDSVAMINEMKKHLNGDFYDISAYYSDIKPCVDCRYCWKNEGCSIKDEGQELYRLLDLVDNLVIASPVYFGELTGPLLSVLSRVQMFYSNKTFLSINKTLKAKNGILFLTAGGNGAADRAIQSANIFFKETNSECLGRVLSLRTDQLPAKDDIAAMDEIKNLADALNNYKSIF